VTTIEKNASFSTYKNEVKQVLLNLIKNAEDVLIERNIDKPLITIVGKVCDKDEITLTIKDNAGGIPESIIDKIFDPYFSTKHKQGGSGLGLYMSKTIIEDHCGSKLTVLNDEDGAILKLYLVQKYHDIKA
jgi:nitrogen fixation/metabolism regulation signal transduction histidine kinase